MNSIRPIVAVLLSIALSSCGGLFGGAEKDDKLGATVVNYSNYPITLELSISEESAENGCGSGSSFGRFTVPPQATQTQATSLKCQLIGYNYYSVSFSASTPMPFVQTWMLGSLSAPIAVGDEVAWIIDGAAPVEGHVSAEPLLLDGTAPLTQSVAPLTVGALSATALAVALAAPVRTDNNHRVQVIAAQGKTVELGFTSEHFTAPPAGSRVVDDKTFIPMDNVSEMRGTIDPAHDGLMIICDNSQCAVK